MSLFLVLRVLLESYPNIAHMGSHYAQRDRNQPYPQVERAGGNLPMLIPETKTFKHFYCA